MIPLLARVRRRRPGPARLLPVASVLGLTLLAGCGSSLLDSTSSTGVATSHRRVRRYRPRPCRSTARWPWRSRSSAAPTRTPTVRRSSRVRAGTRPSWLPGADVTRREGRLLHRRGPHPARTPGWACSLVTRDRPRSAPRPRRPPRCPARGRVGPADRVDVGQSGPSPPRAAPRLAVFPANDPVPPASGPPHRGPRGSSPPIAPPGRTPASTWCAPSSPSRHGSPSRPSAPRPSRPARRPTS